MRCDSIRESLSAYADGQAAADEARLVEGHLTGCAGCRTRLELLRKMKAAVKTAPVPSMPADLRRALLKRARPSFMRRLAGLLDAWKVPLGAAAGAFAAAALFLLVRATSEEALPVEVLLKAHSRYALTVSAPPAEEVTDDDDRG